MLLITFGGGDNSNPPPLDSYVLQNLDQAEINYGATQSDYLVLDTYTIIQYPFERFVPDGCTLDTTRCTLDCYPDLANPLAANTVFRQEKSNDVTFKFGIVKGDRSKREFINPMEIWQEQTYLVRGDKGCQNMRLSVIDSEGFMGDTFGGGQGGTRTLLHNSASSTVLTQVGATAVYQSAILPLYTEEGDTIAIYGGVGYTYLPKILNSKFLFYTAGDVLVSTVDTEYLKHETIPPTATKFRLQTEGVGTETAGVYDITVVLNPAQGLIIHDSYIRDHHRGGISNVPNNTLIENCVFGNTTFYYNKPQFPDSTRYSMDLEDCVSNYVEVKNCTFTGKFHSILVVSCIQVKFENLTFIDNVYNYYQYRVKKPSTMIGGTALGGIISSFGHTDIPRGVLEISDYTLTNSTVSSNVDFNIHHNTMIGGTLNTGGGVFENNTLTGVAKNFNDYRGMKNNLFQDGTGKGYLNVAATDSYVIVPTNTFVNQPLKINSGGNFLHIGGTYTYDNPLVEYETGDNALLKTIVFNGCVFDGLPIVQRTINLSSEDRGSHYFYNCTIDIGVATQFLLVYNNIVRTTHNRFYFKNCVITSATTKYLIKRQYSGVISELILDGCTVSPNVLFDAVPTYAHVPNRARYIRVYNTGSTLDTNNIDFRAIEIYAYGSATNIALGKQVKINGVTNVSGITDGTLIPTTINTGGKLTYVEIDLGVITDVEKVTVKRIVGRTYTDSKVVYAETAHLDAEVIISTNTNYVEVTDGLITTF